MDKHYPRLAPLEGEGDDKDFIAIVNRLLAALIRGLSPRDAYVVRIRGWFDHKWLGFSGVGRVPFDAAHQNHPGVALDEFHQGQLTFPPFTPNRVLGQYRWPRRGVHLTENKPVHWDEFEHSAWNLHRRVADFAESAVFVWFSSATRTNQRGSLLVYTVEHCITTGWYASLRRRGEWKLDRVKGVSNATVETLLSAPPT